MKKPVPRETRASLLEINECQDCGNSLVHDVYTGEELEEMEIKLGKNQRMSFCENCEILYVNSSTSSKP